MKAALIHLEPRQKARLAKRARLRGNSFSKEIRDAVDYYLEIPPEQADQIGELARAANLAADHIITNLDDAIAAVRRVRKRAEKK